MGEGEMDWRSGGGGLIQLRRKTKAEERTTWPGSNGSGSGQQQPAAGTGAGTGPRTRPGTRPEETGETWSGGIGGTGLGA